MERSQAMTRSPLLGVPIEVLANILDRLSPLDVVVALHACGDLTLNRRMRQGGITRWHDASSTIHLPLLEFASSSLLVSVALRFDRCHGSLLNAYVRSLPPALRSLLVEMDSIRDDFFLDSLDDSSEDGSAFSDALVPSHTYTCSAKPWLIRKSFPKLESLLIYGYDSYVAGSDLLAEPTFIVQLLAGLPDTLTELAYPAIDTPHVDIFRLLPPNLRKLRLASPGRKEFGCYPSARHSLVSLEHLEICLTERTAPQGNLGHWNPTTDLMELVFPPFLTRLKIECLHLPTNLPAFPATLETLIFSSHRALIASHPFALLSLIPVSLTHFRANLIGFQDAQHITGSLDSLKPLPKLKRFELGYYLEDFDYEDSQEDESKLWLKVVSLLPVIEDFSLVGASFGLQHLELFSPTLRKLTVELMEFGDTPLEASTILRQVLPNVEVHFSGLEARLLSTPSVESEELELFPHFDDNFDWTALTPQRLPRLSQLTLPVDRVGELALEAFSTLTHLSVHKETGTQLTRAATPTHFTCPPNLTQLSLYQGVAAHFYPLPATLTQLACTNPLPSEVQKCSALRFLTIYAEPGRAHSMHTWTDSHFPTSLEYLSVPTHTLTTLIANDLNAFCQRRPHLVTIHASKSVSSELMNKMSGLPKRVEVTGIDLGWNLIRPSELASLGGFANGEIVLRYGEDIINCANRWIGPKAYNIRPINFGEMQATDAEMLAFMPLLSPSTTKLELGHFSLARLPLKWPTSLTTLIFEEGKIYEYEASHYNLPDTLKTLIIRHYMPNSRPRLDESLPKGLTRLEVSNWTFDYVLHLPPALRTLNASFTSDCLLDNLNALPSSITHLVLKATLKPEHFDLLPSSLKCLECSVPPACDVAFAEAAKSRGFIWINRLDATSNDDSHFNFESTLDHILSAVRRA